MIENLKLGIHFISKEVEELYERNSGIQKKGSTGFDLLNIEEVKFNKFNAFQLINLGVIIKPPEGFHSILIPRSSTFKKFHILQVNSCGLIDESYCGEEDIWKFPALFDSTQLSDMTIHKGSRICQFFIQPKYIFETYNFIPISESRGGFGSTGH
jgi:dUTP pyrophosphatase